MLRFTDGVCIDTSGTLRILYAPDGMYVIGNNMCCPVKNEDEAIKLINELEKSIIEENK